MVYIGEQKFQSYVAYLRFFNLDPKGSVEKEHVHTKLDAAVHELGQHKLK